ncbi:MAG: type I-C CRISPR-associated endonuclease Cas1c [Spirochaetes bacterium]|jgi:CRISPR-associated protein Cas1|nr:type I-C CRISPR-associated endonuclease Cas1c [Spirochaetota bacterium]
MKKHLNTLYVTSPDAFLRKEGMTFVVMLDNKKAFQAPVHTIENIVLFGYKAMSPSLMAFCAENNIGISFLSMNGKFLAKVVGKQSGNVLLRKQQYKFSDSDKESSAIAKNIVAAKIKNMRSTLQRHIRNHGDLPTGDIQKTIDKLKRSLLLLVKADNLDSIRGYEGEASACYFSNFDNLIVSQKEDFFYKKRSKRPPLDRVNALLSFLYSILAHDCRSSLETTGLDVQVGFLHRLRSGRPGLALDLMEEFRSYIADRVVLNLINLKKIKASDFDVLETGETRMNDSSRKMLLQSYQQRKDEIITHPFLGEKTTIGMLPHIQAQLMARYIRGDMEQYTPFIVR